MDCTPIKNKKIQIYQNKSFFKIYNSNQKYNNKINNDNKINSFSLSPTSTYYDNSQNKTNYYSKLSFDKKLQITQINKSYIFKIKKLSSEKEIKERENSYLKFLKKKSKSERKLKIENRKNNEIKLLKVKFNKLIKNNQLKICDNFIHKTNSLNMKIMEYFKGKNYLKQKVNYHNKFRFDTKSDSRIKMMTDIDKIKNNSELHEKLDFEKNFDEKEKNLILKDSNTNYFINEIKSFNNIHIKTNKLVDIINEEENKTNKNEIVNKNKLKLKFSFDKKKIKKKLQILNDKIINYKEIDKEVKKILNKKLQDEIKEENRIKNLERNFKKLNHKIKTIQSERILNKNFNKYFNHYLSTKNKKEYSLNKNYNHLQNLHPEIIKNQTVKSERDKKFLNYCLNKITGIYKKEDNNNYSFDNFEIKKIIKSIKTKQKK